MRASSGLWSGSPNPVRSEDAFDIVSLGGKTVGRYEIIESGVGTFFERLLGHVRSPRHSQLPFKLIVMPPFSPMPLSGINTVML